MMLNFTLELANVFEHVIICRVGGQRSAPMVSVNAIPGASEQAGVDYAQIF